MAKQSSPQTQNIPVFILAGGLGTRISEETALKPKPMVELGEVPILVHVMRSYYRNGFNDFVILGGYRVWEIKNYFLNYEFRQNHLSIDHRSEINAPPRSFGKSLTQENWRVRVLDTGLSAMTGARVARGIDMIEAAGEKIENFALTYGDGLSNHSFAEELDFHQQHGKIGTVLGVLPTARFGEFDFEKDGTVKEFVEKPQSKQAFVNGGFFYFKREFRNYLSTDESCVLEQQPLAKLADDRQLSMFPHRGFWQPMDTLRDKTYLEGLWNSGKAPWTIK